MDVWVPHPGGVEPGYLDVGSGPSRHDIQVPLDWSSVHGGPLWTGWMAGATLPAGLSSSGLAVSASAGLFGLEFSGIPVLYGT